MNQVISLRFSAPCRDQLSQLSKRITRSTNISLNVKRDTDQNRDTSIASLQVQRKHSEKSGPRNQKYFSAVLAEYRDLKPALEDRLQT